MTNEIKWIKVEDRLPDTPFHYLLRYETVLCCSRPVLCVLKPRTSKRPVYRVKQGEYHRRGSNGWFVVNDKCCDVIAWAPMPKYKEEENG